MEKEAHCRFPSHSNPEIHQRNSRREIETLRDELRRMAGRNSQLKQELAHVLGCKRYQIGDAFVLAGALAPRELLKLPVRLWRVLCGPNVFRHQHCCGSSVPARTGQDCGAASRLRREFESFVQRVMDEKPERLVVMFGGTTYIQNVRANRPIRLTRVLARMGIRCCSIFTVGVRAIIFRTTKTAWSSNRR